MALALASQQSLLWMTPGQHVFIRDVSTAEYMSMHWVVQEAPREGRVVLRAKIEEDGMEKVIRVSVDKVYPATLCAEHKQQVCDDALVFQFDVPFHWKVEAWIMSRVPLILPGGSEPDLHRYLKKWVPLPGLGRNSIMVQRRERRHPRPLLMFPRLEQLDLELMFHSTWSGQFILVVEADILKCCPANQIWPYCAWCRKFHCPVDGHRNGKMHARCQYYLETLDVEYLRHEIGFWDVQGRWL